MTKSFSISKNRKDKRLVCISTKDATVQELFRAIGVTDAYCQILTNEYNNHVNLASFRVDLAKERLAAAGWVEVQ